MNEPNELIPEPLANETATSDTELKAALEALLFVNERPIEAKELTEILGVNRKKVDQLLAELIQNYLGRDSGICVVQVAGGYQMCSTPKNEIWVKKMYQERNKQKLSIAALETLAIVAYKQPLTKAEIEAIRGVNADGVTKNLTNLGFIKIEGRKEVIGRPFLYITTRKFLEYFGLNSIKDLPQLEEFAALAQTDQIIKDIVTTSEVTDQQNLSDQKEES